MTKAKSTTAARKSKAAKRTDRGVPFAEMRRLMHTYGPIKCLRKRQPPAGKGGEEAVLPAKVDSVKRKFYRWFPDLEERFVRDEGTGAYRPRFGHEFEMRYREEMRTRDGEVLARKRARCRKARHGAASGAGAAGAGDDNKSRQRGGSNKQHKQQQQQKAAAKSRSAAPARVSPVLAPPRAAVARTVSRDGSGDALSSAPPLPRLAAPFSSQEGPPLEIDLDHVMASSSDACGGEPVDGSFVAQRGIFDDVEADFFGMGPPTQDYDDVHYDCGYGAPPLPAVVARDSSSSSSSSGGGESDDRAAVEDVDEVLDRSIEECCEEMLGGSSSSGDDDSVSGYLFDMIHSD